MEKNSYLRIIFVFTLFLFNISIAFGQLKVEYSYKNKCINFEIINQLSNNVYVTKESHNMDGGSTIRLEFLDKDGKLLETHYTYVLNANYFEVIAPNSKNKFSRCYPKIDFTKVKSIKIWMLLKYGYEDEEKKKFKTDIIEKTLDL